MEKHPMDFYQGVVFTAQTVAPLQLEMNRLPHNYVIMR